MSVTKTPFYYRPDEYFDFGIAGEHPVVFVAWLDHENRVTIVRAYAEVQSGGPVPFEWDFTSEIKKYPGRRERYEEEIKRDYLSKRERDWEAS